MRVSYSGYYGTLPKFRGQFDPDYPHQFLKKKKKMNISHTFTNNEVALAAHEQALQNDPNASLNEQLCLSFAYTDSPEAPSMQDFMNSVEARLRWMQEDMNYSLNAYRDHLNGHIPAIKDAGRMNDVLKKLGLDDAFEVEKHRVFVQY